jgi:hypothetical protein
VPFFPFPFLTVTNVYNSPCDTATSSILKKVSIFSGKIK